MGQRLASQAPCYGMYFPVCSPRPPYHPAVCAKSTDSIVPDERSFATLLSSVHLQHFSAPLLHAIAILGEFLLLPRRVDMSVGIYVNSCTRVHVCVIAFVFVHLCVSVCHVCVCVCVSAYLFLCAMYDEYRYIYIEFVCVFLPVNELCHPSLFVCVFCLLTFNYCWGVSQPLC